MSIEPMIKSSAMPAQTVIPLPPGATSPMNAGYINQQNQIKSQMNLIGSGKRKRSRGGAPVVEVPPVSSSAPNSQLTGSNFKDLTQLAQTQQTQAAFDTAKTASDTASIQQQQQSLYKSGGSKIKSGSKRKYKKGGSWPKWECLSGGKKSKRKGRKGRKGRKTRKSKRHN